jgi:hypothetical protein
MNDNNLIPDLKTALTKEGVAHPDAICVAMMTTDAIIGESASAMEHHEAFDDYGFRIRNPKRLVRIQRITPEGLNVESAIIDFDMMVDGGEIVVRPQGVYFLTDLGPEGQITLLKMLLGYYDSARKRRAAAVGLELPGGKIHTNPR